MRATVVVASRLACSAEQTRVRVPNRMPRPPPAPEPGGSPRNAQDGGWPSTAALLVDSCWCLGLFAPSYTPGGFLDGDPRNLVIHMLPGRLHKRPFNRLGHRHVHTRALYSHHARFGLADSSLFLGLEAGPYLALPAVWHGCRLPSPAACFRHSFFYRR